MASATALNMLRGDLGMLGGALPPRIKKLLEQKLEAAERELADMKLVLVEDDSADLDLIVSYAAWLYRKRQDGDAMPLMLKTRLNNRKVNRATGGAR